MCHLSMKFPDMFDQNPPYTSDRIEAKFILIKNTLSRLDLEPKGQDHGKNQKPMPHEAINMPPLKI